MNRGGYIDVDYAQAAKHGQPVSGDVFLSRRIKEEDRIVAVLADGLGSGIKASVLATLTGTMAVRLIAADHDARQTARLILETLPVCSERKIGYSTFTIVDLDEHGAARILEHDNPPFLHFRGATLMDVAKSTFELTVPTGLDRPHVIHESALTIQPEDRLILFSDGVTQSGMGRRQMPLGWGLAAVAEFARRQIQGQPGLSARDLARRMVEEAQANDSFGAKDDTTCAVLYFRRPRHLLVVTGPPFARANDRLVAQAAGTFDGRVILCGGTTAGIVARELKRDLQIDLTGLSEEIPPTSLMPGIDLVTEGTITLGKLTELLEAGTPLDELRPNGATAMARLLRDSDIIHFLVGTRINEAHQDPHVPVELDIRRNIVKRIRTLLEEKYLKETHLEFV